MLIRTLFIVVILVGLSHCPGSAQDASGRDPGSKIVVKPTPKVVSPPVRKPSPKSASPKETAKVIAKPKVSKPVAKVPIANRKVAPAPVAKKTSAPPAPTVSRLTLSVVPNAHIELAGKMSGVTGQDGKLVLSDTPYGKYSLKVTADGYEPWSGTVEVKTAATEFSVSLKKRATAGTLAITVNQPGADVFINEKLNVKSVAGQQITVEGLLPGTHQIRAVKSGYKEWHSVVRISVGEISRVEVVLTPGVSPEMVRVAAGEFVMGNDRGPKDSSPAHPVSLGEFEISRREVTNQFYKSFLDATKHAPPDPQLSGWQGNSFPADKADAPVTGTTWDDAAAFCKWLSQEAGGTYRLPTEAEWERAARSVGNVYQSIGVVWEWCQDWYDAEYYKRKDRLSPQGSVMMPQSGKDKTRQERVIRGGAASAAGRAVRVFERNAAPPAQGSNDIGFRVVRELGR